MRFYFRGSYWRGIVIMSDEIDCRELDFWRLLKDGKYFSASQVAKHLSRVL